MSVRIQGKSWFKLYQFLALIVILGVIACSGGQDHPLNIPSSHPQTDTGNPVQHYSFVLQGYTRSYDLYVPSSYTGSAAVPLVLDFHGIYSSAEEERTTSGLQAKADAEGFIVAYPEGLNGPGGKSWNADTTHSQWYSWSNVINVDDVAFAVKLVQDVRSKLNIDARRIYVAGLSQGGSMALLCAHDRGDIFAAAAVISSILLKDVHSYNPVRPVSIISFNSYDDAVVPYNGFNLFGIPSIEDTVLQWAIVNGCDTSHPTVTSLGFTDPDHPTVAEKITTYGGGSGGVEVTLYSLHGTHILYTTNMHGSTVAEKQQYVMDRMWNFLKRFTLP